MACKGVKEPIVASNQIKGHESKMVVCNNNFNGNYKFGGFHESRIKHIVF